MSEPGFFYANSMQITTSAFDIVFEFVRLGALNSFSDPRLGETTPEIRARQTVAMSPQHAKAMLASMLSTLQQYEKTVGPVPVNAETQRVYDKLSAAAPLGG